MNKLIKINTKDKYSKTRNIKYFKIKMAWFIRIIRVLILMAVIRISVIIIYNRLMIIGIKAYISRGRMKRVMYLI